MPWVADYHVQISLESTLEKDVKRRLYGYCRGFRASQAVLYRQRMVLGACISWKEGAPLAAALPR